MQEALGIGVEKVFPCGPPDQLDIMHCYMMWTPQDAFTEDGYHEEWV